MASHRNITGLQRLSFAGSIVLITSIAAFSAGSAVAAADSTPTSSMVKAAEGLKAPFTVSAMDNVFGAGLATPPDPGGNGGGVLPFQVAVPTGTVNVTFSHVAGNVSFALGVSNGPDGYRGLNMNISATGGISGLMDTHRYFYLVGVFLDGGQPTSPPSTLNFTKDHSFQSLAPVLGQVFFVGDGLTGRGKGENQDFAVPGGATTLYLGFADAPDGQGPPGAYQDNTGSLSGNIHFKS